MCLMGHAMSKSFCMKTCGLVVAIALILLGVGCASAHPLGDDPFAAWPGEDQVLNAQRDRLKSQRVHASLQQQTPIELKTVPEDATANDYVYLALGRHPGLRAARQKVSRLAQRVPQAVALSDPMLMVSPVGQMPQTAAGEVAWMAGISQRLPYPGKQGIAGRIAGQAVAVAAAEYRRLHLGVIADTRRAYWGYYYATRAIDATRASRNLLEQFHKTAQAKFQAGQATQQDVLRASLELSNLGNELITLRQRKATAAAMLNRLVDRPVDASLPMPKSRDLQSVVLSLRPLLEVAEQSNPEVSIVREKIESFRHRVALAKLNRKPDLTLSAQYNGVDRQGLSGVANGDDQWWLGLGINLPIWTSRLDAAEREAQHGLLENISALHEAKNSIAFRVQDALVRVETQQRQVVLFRDVIVPQARQVVDASLSGYRAGKVDFLTLVDNWRKWLDFKLMYHRNLAQLEQDLASLEQVVGQAVRTDPSPDDFSSKPQRGGGVK